MPDSRPIHINHPNFPGDDRLRVQVERFCVQENCALFPTKEPAMFRDGSVAPLKIFRIDQKVYCSYAQEAQDVI